MPRCQEFVNKSNYVTLANFMEINLMLEKKGYNVMSVETPHPPATKKAGKRKKRRK